MNGSIGGIRTHIFHVLSVLPLPIGLRCYMVELDGVGPVNSALSERCFAVELQLEWCIWPESDRRLLVGNQAVYH